MNEAFGVAHRIVQRAIEDLKRLGFWDDLTGHLFAVRISSRNGAARIPEDEHLADAVWLAYQDPKTGKFGDICDVFMFTRAIRNDVANQNVYYTEGRLEAPPPTLRQFWAVLLGHELAHCTNRGQKGEAYSTSWEVRILDGFGADRVGSP